MINDLLFILGSLVVGLLIGMERERNHPEGSHAIGVRTFALISILSTTLSLLAHPVFTTIAAVFVFTLITLNYALKNWKQPSDVGMTTELAAGIVFIIGYMLPNAPTISLAIAAMVLLLLVERKRLHRFSREGLVPQEIEAIVLIAIIGFGILPILPDKAVDPWALFNPRQFCFLVLILACMQFVGFIAIKMIGQRAGCAILGFFGGLVSSTAVYATLPRMVGKNEKLFWSAQVTAIFSIIAMLVQVVVILFFAAYRLLSVLQWPLVWMIICGLILAMTVLHHKVSQQDDKAVAESQPVDFKSLVRTTLIISVIFLILALMKHYFNTAGMMLSSFLGGLFELHGVTLATALLYTEKQFSLNQATMAIGMAVMASFISKLILLIALSSRRFAIVATFNLFIILTSGVSVYYFLEYLAT